MLLQCGSIILVFALSVFAQASLLQPSKSDTPGLDRLHVENDLSGGMSLLKEILEKSSNMQFQDLERLTEPLRTKRCRWKLCGTGRRFRYF